MITVLKIRNKKFVSSDIIDPALNKVAKSKFLQFWQVAKQQLICLLLIAFCQVPTNSKADDIATFEWMTTPLSGLARLFSTCLEPPKNIGFNVASQTLNLANQGKWVSTGSKVRSGKLIRFDWSTKGIEARPRKYLILYRIDPRFPVPQVYIQTYDYIQSKYVSDFHKFQNGKLVNYQTKPYINWNERITDNMHYFNFEGRSEIPVNIGDIINITLVEKDGSVKKEDFFSNLGDFTAELQDGFATPSINYTPSFPKDNRIIYTSAPVWCAALDTDSTYSAAVCAKGKYKNPNNATSFVVGKIDEPKFLSLLATLKSCPVGINTKDLDSLCYYDNGRGMKISIGSQSIKDEGVGFIHSNFLGKNFFYHKAESSGNLKLGTDWEIDNMFVNFQQMMSSWNTYADLDALVAALNSESVDLNMNFLHFGRYILSVEIGNGNKTISFAEESGVKVEYAISDVALDDSFTGTAVSKNMRIDAPKDGYLWLRVINPNTEVQGVITVNYANYTGSAVMSNIIYNKVITPLRKKFNELTEMVYKKLASDPILKRIGKLMLTLYIILYGLFFLSGATKITVEDIVIRVIKISIIIALFSESSWTFFNQNLFQIFINGTDYIMTNVVDASSSVGNVFGFIDPVIDKYTNGRVWGLLFIQLLQIHNGLALLAIMTMYSIILFFRAVLEVIIGYCLAFVGLAVMISLAPLFIILLLFEQTKSIFDNWISTLFDYMIQPTILLVFFLLIDQMIGQQLTGAVTRACWGCLIPLKIGLDLRHIGIPIDFSFTLPFLPCIPFFVTSVSAPGSVGELFEYSGSFLAIATSTLLFYTYCKMSHGLVEYITIITSSLTNVVPARQEGKIQQQENATASVMNDIKGITTRPLAAVGSTIKSKTIDQNYRSQPTPKAEPENYSGQISSGSRHDAPEGNKNTTQGPADKNKGGNNA